ncbi:hypothetical protein DRE_07640 [Drechslerella stenobrocha 248]|uniref:Ribosomal RNA-processing protein 43 n=1 Tax=Drechslerella stenobrocha 248 TaxID=1043628 RepID=W7HSF9_9PEZI|nr:hypothetical protein DRE_07640 [Drechslerella stenobrocha 248]
MAAPSPPNGKNPSTGTVSVGNSRAPPLTFSTALFRHISPALYLQRHLNHVPPARPSGRYPSQHRDFTLTTNSLSHAHGSAVVRTGDTAVVCGVRGEVLTLAPGDDFLAFESHHRSQTSTAYASGSRGSGGASWGELVVPNLELSTGCSKKYPLGPPGASAQTISDQIQELIQVSKLVDLKSLRIYAQAGSQGSPPATIRGYWSFLVRHSGCSAITKAPTGHLEPDRGTHILRQII